MNDNENGKRAASSEAEDDITKEPDSKRLNLSTTPASECQSIPLFSNTNVDRNNSSTIPEKIQRHDLATASHQSRGSVDPYVNVSSGTGVHSIAGVVELGRRHDEEDVEEEELEPLENSSSAAEASSNSVDSNNGPHALSTPMSNHSLPAVDSLDVSSPDLEESDDDVDGVRRILDPQQLLMYVQEQHRFQETLASGAVYGPRARHQPAAGVPDSRFPRRVVNHQAAAALSRRQRLLLMTRGGVQGRGRNLDAEAEGVLEDVEIDEDSKGDEEDGDEEEVSEDEEDDEDGSEGEDEEEDSEVDDSDIDEPVSPSIIRHIMGRGAMTRLRQPNTDANNQSMVRNMNARHLPPFTTAPANKRDRHGRMRSQRNPMVQQPHLMGLPGQPANGLPARFMANEMYFREGGCGLLRSSPYGNVQVTDSNASLSYDSNGVPMQEDIESSPLTENIADVSLPDGGSFGSAGDRSGNKQQLDLSLDEIQPPSPMSAARAHYWKVDDDDCDGEEDDEPDVEDGTVEGAVTGPVVQPPPDSATTEEAVPEPAVTNTLVPAQPEKDRSTHIFRKARFAGCIGMTVKDVSKTIGKEAYREGRKMFSESVTIRCLPWRILFMPRYNAPTNLPRDPHYQLQQQQQFLNTQLLQTPASGDEENSNDAVAAPTSNANQQQIVDPFLDPHRWTLGFFVQCQPSVSQVHGLWSCNARAELRLLSQKEGVPDMVKHIEHNYFSKENDWGFTNFISYADLLNPDKGYIKDDTIVLKARVRAEAPHGLDWDSKKFTGYVGLKNLGATCYLNSLMQAWFFTNKLRKAVYQIPLDPDEDVQKSIPLALQRLFYDLQFSHSAVNTKKLTRSFGWETLECYLQHDAQELCRVLLDNLEVKMRGGPMEDTIPSLFRGRMLSYVRCKHVDFESKREEAFYDVQLNVKGFRNIQESFRDYVTVETLDGDNRYDAGEHGLQEAQKGVIFLHFPPVLYLQLMRFRYDMHLDANIKVNDYFAFPYRLELDEFLETVNPDSPATYILHAVLVHSGDNNGGHYVVYINPELKNRWFKFDDDVVSSCPRREAVEQNYGFSDGDVCIRHTANAYMLVYVRESARDDVLCPVSRRDIPRSLRRRLREERLLDERRRREKAEAQLFTCFSLYFDEDFHSWQGFELCDFTCPPDRRLRLYKTNNVRELTSIIANYLHRAPQTIRLWSLHLRRTQRVGVLELRGNESHVDLYVEMVAVSSPLIHILPFDTKHDLLIFFKCFDPVGRYMHFLGCSYHRIGTLVYSMLQSHPLPLCCHIWRSSSISSITANSNTTPEEALQVLEREWDLFEERRPLYLHRIPNWRLRIEEVLECVNDGAIFVLQPSKAGKIQRTSCWLSPVSMSAEEEEENVVEPEREQCENDKENHEKAECTTADHVPTGDSRREPTNAALLSSDVEEYMTEQFYMTTITFVSVQEENDMGFQLQLPLNTSLKRVARAVARYLDGNCSPERLQFSCAHVTPTGSVHFVTLKSTLEDLRQVFPHTGVNGGGSAGAMHRGTTYQQQPQLLKLYYRVLDMSVKELEALCTVNAIFVSSSLQEEGELSASLHCMATVEDFLTCVRSQIPVEKLSTPLAPLRLMEVSHSRILRLVPNSCRVGQLLNSSSDSHHHSNATLRVEEIPVDELHMGTDEYIMFVSHIHKDSVVPFGVPFTVKVVEGEAMMHVRDRIRTRLAVSINELQQWRFALIISNRASYFPDDHCAIVRLKKYLTPVGTLTGWLGIEHKLPLPKKHKLLSTERPIKIHN